MSSEDPADWATAEAERLCEHNRLSVKHNADWLTAALRQAEQRGREQTRCPLHDSERLAEFVKDERGIYELCKECGGWGKKSYPSTATWRGGIGGQMFTTDVCDKCWGSGDTSRPWPSWRAIRARGNTE